ncbi:MAG: START domain-containing protein [Pseudomonadaceae bacterium]|nr:START domain-containing protein [Pseudomonadaceae bacterium]
MSKPWIIACALLLVSPFACVAAVGDDAAPWELKRDKDGITVYTRPVEGSNYRAVQAVMTVAATPSAAVALIFDTDACPQWADLCKESRVFEAVSETEMFVYTLNDIPWPVSDRDATTHVVWEHSESDGTVTMTATVVSDKLPKTGRTVRLSEGTTNWIFRPLPDGQLEITSRAHIEPGGAIPGWLSNRLLVDSPFTTMQGMRELLLSGRYDDVEIAFLDGHQDRAEVEAVDLSEHATDE